MTNPAEELQKPVDRRGRLQPRTRYRMVATAAAVAGSALLAASCSITPLAEVESQAPTSTPPQSLALVAPATVDDSDEVAADTVDRNASTPADQDALVETGASEALLVDTTSARIGVHSAPGYSYTRLGVLEPGDGVISTGRSVAIDDTTWLEVHWLEATAWVADAGLARVE